MFFSSFLTVTIHFLTFLYHKFFLLLWQLFFFPFTIHCIDHIFFLYMFSVYLRFQQSLHNIFFFFLFLLHYTNMPPFPFIKNFIFHFSFIIAITIFLSLFPLISSTLPTHVPSLQFHASTPSLPLSPVTMSLPPTCSLPLQTDTHRSLSNSSPFKALDLYVWCL